MRNAARHLALAHLFEPLELRMLLSASAVAPLVGALPDPVIAARHYRAAAVSGDANAGDTAQAYFDVRKRMSAAVPVLTVHAGVSNWNAGSTGEPARMRPIGEVGDVAALSYTWTLRRYSRWGLW